MIEKFNSKKDLSGSDKVLLSLLNHRTHVNWGILFWETALGNRNTQVLNMERHTDDLKRKWGFIFVLHLRGLRH